MTECSSATPSELPARFVAHTPVGPVTCCAAHAQHLEILMMYSLGIHVIFHDADPGLQCENCVNETAKLRTTT